MVTLIIGTPDSGKSLLAESIAMEVSGDLARYYIATMVPFGKEGNERVEKHRKMRDGKGFITLEWADNISSHIKDIDFSKATILLECISNLVGNEMHAPDNIYLPNNVLVNKISKDIFCLAEKSKNLILVSNEFPLKDDGYDSDTERYVQLLSDVNEEIKKGADVILIREKGEWCIYENN